jgi:DNA-binding transcriptional ArsR family regulator
LLTVLLLHPGTEYTMSELSRKLSLPLATAQREVNRLSEAGLIAERRVGRARVISANPASRYTRPLTELLHLAFGPHVVIGELRGVPRRRRDLGLGGAPGVAGASGRRDVLVIEPSRADVWAPPSRPSQRIWLPGERDRLAGALGGRRRAVQQIRSAPGLGTRTAHGGKGMARWARGAVIKAPPGRAAARAVSRARRRLAVARPCHEAIAAAVSKEAGQRLRAAYDGCCCSSRRQAGLQHGSRRPE